MIDLARIEIPDVPERDISEIVPADCDGDRIKRNTSHSIKCPVERIENERKVDIALGNISSLNLCSSPMNHFLAALLADEQYPPPVIPQNLDCGILRHLIDLLRGCSVSADVEFPS
ncbi:MAG: hypothetical protein C5S49_02495 [Candidatus Methanogaster sp.]|nr:MAG: hypothetical protein C5S49_02495 [ANME-2 cluster archaeon]